MARTNVPFRDESRTLTMNSLPSSASCVSSVQWTPPTLRARHTDSRGQMLWTRTDALVDKSVVGPVYISTENECLVRGDVDSAHRLRGLCRNGDQFAAAGHSLCASVRSL